MITTTVEHEVRDTLAAAVAAWDANDPDAFADLYTEDATAVTHGGLVMRGREAIRASMAAAFAGPRRGTRSLDEPESVAIHGDAAVVVSRSGILEPGETAPPAERLRRATWTLVRRNDRWAIQAYHNCAIL